jgi:sortase A
MTSSSPETSDGATPADAPDPRPFPLAALVAVLLFAGLGLVGWTVTAEGDDGGGGTDGRATATADEQAEQRATTTTSAPATTTTAPPRSPAAAPRTRPAAPPATLPVPEDAPPDPYADTPAVVHGTLSLPTIGVSQPLQEGVTLTAVNRGPGHWPGTAMPGQRGNVVVAGHRTTYSRPFHDLDLLKPGDPLIFTMNDGTVWTYEMTGTSIVGPDGMHIVQQTPDYTATLFACHPKGSAAQRIVGHFRLVDPPPPRSPAA